MKKFLLGFSSFLLALPIVLPLQTYAISESQKSVISRYCGTIKQSLKTLQRTDINSRVKLGSKYETALTKFITPLNLRIVKNNLSVSKLAELQTTFANYKTNFASDFTTYSKLLEELIGIDCQEDPTTFYLKLSETREARENVNKDVNKLNETLHEYQKIVTKMGKEYEK